MHKLILVYIYIVTYNCLSPFYLVNHIVEMYSRSNQFFIQYAVMLIIKPIAVDNVDISHHFIDWNPEALKLAI